MTETSEGKQRRTRKDKGAERGPRCGQFILQQAHVTEIDIHWTDEVVTNTEADAWKEVAVAGRYRVIRQYGKERVAAEQTVIKFDVQS